MLRIHLGSGREHLPGWTNVDVKPYPGVDAVLDVREGLPFSDASFIFAEHFIEHFTLDEATALLRECRRVLLPDGVLRLTTPNLDWVWATSYSSRWTARSATEATIEIGAWRHDEAAARDCVLLNRAFRAWGHKFLYNAAMLGDVLGHAGFAHVRWCEYGRSEHAELRELERHERYDDSPQLPHLLIAEATGVAAPERASALDEVIAEYLRDAAVD